MSGLACLDERGISKWEPPVAEMPWQGSGTWKSVRDDVEAREHLQGIFDAKQISNKDYAGTNVAILEHERTRKRLIQLLQRFESDGFSFGSEQEITCNSDSIEAASAFIKALPRETRLPKVAPDGEGGVILAWETSHREVVMSVHGWTLYAVVNPSAEAEYLPITLFDGDSIPESLLSVLPLA